MRRIVVGVALLAVGSALATLGIFKAGNPAEPLAFLAIPAGLVRQFTSSVGAGRPRVTWTGGEVAGRAFFAAIGLWLRLVRGR